MTEYVAFHWADYVIFVVTLGISVVIGVVFMLLQRSSKSRSEYLVGTGKMAVLPVAISMVVSGVNSTGILGFPAEVYLYGPASFVLPLGWILSLIIQMIIYVPMFYRLKLTSVNEYYSRRFRSPGFERFITIQAVINVILIGGAPTLVVAQSVGLVTPIPTDAMIVIITVIGTLYTTIGGYRGVIWADVFQASVLMAAMILISIRGMSLIGGWHETWDIYFEWERDEFINWSFSPTTRYTFWSTVVASVLSFDLWQPHYQRFRSMATLTKAQVATVLSSAGGIIYLYITLMAGVVAFSYYADIGCDPIISGKVTTPNQIVPYFVTDAINVPGIPGMFIAGLLAAVLSSLSSSINGWVALFITMLPEHTVSGMSDRHHTILLKGLAIAFGGVYLASAFLAKGFPATVKQITSAMGGSFAGAVGATRFLGTTIPWLNAKCGIVAFLLGYIPFIVLSVASSTQGLSNPPLPLPYSECENFTLPMTSVNGTAPEPANDWGGLLSLGFYLYSPLTFTVTYISGVLLSLIPFFRTDYETPDELLIPFIVRLNVKKLVKLRDSKNTTPVEDDKSSNVVNGVVNQGHENQAYYKDQPPQYDTSVSQPEPSTRF